MRYNGILIPKVTATLLLIISGSLVHAQVSGDGQCAECHFNSSLLDALTEQPERFHISPDFIQSVHNDISCIGCHADPGGHPHPEVMGIIQCGTCHEEELKEYLGSPHGNPLTLSMELAPKCWDCHKLHLIRKSSNDLSNVHINNEAKTCAVCHGNEDFNRRIITLPNLNNEMPDRTIKKGIHYLNGQNPLTCSRCHRVHSLNEERGKSWQSDYSMEEDFCGECHDAETTSFKRNFHFEHGIASTNGEISLTCSDCHQEHLVTDDKYQNNEELSAGEVTDSCIECHSSVKISGRFAQNIIGFNSSIDSFHGTSNLGGELFFSNCASCHGIHELKTYTGMIKENKKLDLISECGTCHPNAASNFVSNPVHMSRGEDLDSEETIAKYIFLAIIITMISLIMFSIIIDFYKLYQRRKNEQ